MLCEKLCNLCVSVLKYQHRNTKNTKVSQREKSYNLFISHSKNTRQP